MAAGSSFSPTSERRETFPGTQPYFEDLSSDLTPHHHTPYSSPVDVRRFSPTFVTDTQSAPSYTTSLSDHSYKIEPLSAVAIFVLLFFYPDDCVIGIYESGELELQPYGWTLEGLDSVRKRKQYNQNGNQNEFLLEPIKEACEIYKTDGPFIGMYFLFAYLGAKKLKGYYAKKGKSAQAKALEPIVKALFEHLLKCHAACPLQPTFTGRTVSLPPVSATNSPPSRPVLTEQSPPSLHPTMLPLKPILWEIGQQQIFVNKIIELFHTDSVIDRERRISTIDESMKMISHFNGIYQRMYFRR